MLKFFALPLALALLVPAAPALAAFALPSSIYPPLVFPRIAVIAHSGTLPPQAMSLIVTRPIEQVVMGVPGKIVRPVKDKEREYMRWLVTHYIELAERYVRGEIVER